MKVRAPFSFKPLFEFGFRFGPVLIVILMSCLVVGGSWIAVHQSRVFAVQAIPLEWKERLDGGRMEFEISKSIEADIGVRFANVLGKRPWEIDLASLANSIRSLPWIADAHIQRVFPDRLVVSIKPKRPLAVIVTSNKKSDSLLRPISQEGELMPEWNSGAVPDVPFLRGERFIRDDSLRARTVALIRALPREGVLARSNLAEISWNDTKDSTSNGFSLLLLSPRTEILLGDSDIEKKVVRVAHVLNYLSSQGKKARVIDSSSVKKVVVKAHHRP